MFCSQPSETTFTSKSSKYKPRDGNCRPHAGLEETENTKDWTLTTYCARLLVCEAGYNRSLGGFMCFGDYKNKASRHFPPNFFFSLLKIMMAAKKSIFLRTNGIKLHRSTLHTWKPKESKGTRHKCQHNTRQQLAGNIFNPQTGCKGLGYNFPPINVVINVLFCFCWVHEAQKCGNPEKRVESDFFFDLRWNIEFCS